jgi:hypothetical protein
LRRPATALARRLPVVDREAAQRAAATMTVSERTTTVTRFRSTPAQTR